MASLNHDADVVTEHLRDFLKERNEYLESCAAYLALKEAVRVSSRKLALLRELIALEDSDGAGGLLVQEED